VAADRAARAAPAVALLAGGWAALAAWLSFGAIAFDGANGPRIGVLPADPLHIAVAISAGAAIAAIGWRNGRSVAIAVSPLALVVLPWLPFTVPAAFLIWTGSLVSLAWIAPAIACGAIALRGREIRLASGPLAAGVFSFIVFAAAAWLASPSLPTGDEPHYLVVTQSLLYDGDLEIENNHRQGDYRAYFTGDLLPHYIRRGRNGQIYSIHAPGLPAIVLPAFAIGGYHGVIVFLLLVSASACALAWWLAWRVTGSDQAAWFGWAAVTFAAPFLLESYTVLPDAPGAAVVLTGVWALLRGTWESEAGGHHEGDSIRGVLPWFFHGLGFALLPWMHTRFAVIAATLGGLILVRLAHAPNPLSKAVAFLSAPALSALGWLFFFVIVYGVPDPTAPYGGDTQNSFAFLSNGLGGLLFDQGFGLLATAPVAVVAFAGFARTKRLALEWLVMSGPYLLAVATYPLWWAGMSGPARFFVPLLLPLAIPAACGWSAAKSRGAHVLMSGALVVSAWLALVMAGAGGGRLGYHARNDAGPTIAPWMDWANRVVDLPAAFPAFVPKPVPPPGGTPLTARLDAARTGLMTTLPWAISLGAAGWLVMWFGRRASRSPESMIAVCALGFGCATMATAGFVWQAKADSAVSPVTSQINALRVANASRLVAVDLTNRRSLDPAAVRAMTIESPITHPGRGAPRIPNRPLASFVDLPAGSYELSVKRSGSADGWLMAGVGNDQFSIVTEPIGDFDHGSRITLPVAVRALSIRAEEAGRDQLDAIVLRPVTLAPHAASRDAAWRAVRYGDEDAFFLDGHVYPEPSGFWVMGGRETEVVIAPDQRRETIALFVRNGANANSVTLSSGAWQTSVALGSSAERRVDVPVTSPDGTARVRIRSSASFRPSDTDPTSRDTRLLGAFIAPETTK
jgi:hypothetical protein